MFKHFHKFSLICQNLSFIFMAPHRIFIDFYWSSLIFHRFSLTFLIFFDFWSPQVRNHRSAAFGRPIDLAALPPLISQPCIREYIISGSIITGSIVTGGSVVSGYDITGSYGSVIAGFSGLFWHARPLRGRRIAYTCYTVFMGTVARRCICRSRCRLVRKLLSRAG